MSSRELKNHPGFFLEEAAAADFDMLEDRHGVFNVTSARRSVESQQQLIDRWNAGGKFNRPPYLYEPFRPASKGPHVKNGGIAVDISDWQRFMRVMGEGNFTHPYDWDVVHFEHNGNRETLAKESAIEYKPATEIVNEKGELNMQWIILVLVAPGSTDNNNMVLINMETREMINLGNSEHSAVRAYYAENHKWRYINLDEWAAKFTSANGFNYSYGI